MAFLGGAFGGAGGQIDKATGQAVAADWTGAQLASDSFWTGHNLANRRYDINYLNPYTNTGNAANQMYANALGLNGPQGNQRATNAFQTDPGYQFATQQGIQALDRSAAGSGMFGSGNAAMALNDYGQGMANQQYGNWLQRLGGLGAQGLTAATQQTARQGALAGIDTWAAGGAAGANLTAGVEAGKNLMQGGIASAQAEMAGGGNLFSALSGGLSLLGKLSDRSLKIDIEKLGKDKDTGLNIYAYRYLTDPKTYPKSVGPMADEVGKKYPGSVFEVGGKKVISANWLAEMANEQKKPASGVNWLAEMAKAA